MFKVDIEIRALDTGYVVASVDHDGNFSEEHIAATQTAAADVVRSILRGAFPDGTKEEKKPVKSQKKSRTVKKSDPAGINDIMKAAIDLEAPDGPSD